MTTTSQPAEPLDRDRLARGIEAANVPTLLLLLVQLTGDERWLGHRYRPARAVGMDDNDTGGLPDDVQDEVRAAARRAIEAWVDGGQVAVPELTPEQLAEMLSVSMADEVPVEYASLVAAELDLSTAAWDQHRVGDRLPPGFSVLIVGAGLSGICAAVRLGAAGIAYEIVERHPDLGGSWWENRYPGAAVDTPSHLYSFSFARRDWSRYFAPQEELHEYLRGIAERHGVIDRIRFDTTVRAARYDETSCRWTVTVADGRGIERTLTPNVLVSAVGVFNTPTIPDVPGRSTFAGDVVHPARWPDGLELAGRRVALVGAGATAMQIGPAIVDEVEHLTVFQRSPHWIAPFPKFGVEVPEDVRYLMRAVPLYQAWYRVRLGWTFNDRLYPSLQKDPAWEFPDRSLNAVNDAHRRHFTAYAESELEGREDLLERSVPRWPPFAKRMLMDNGWYRLIRRPDVTLVSEGIRELTPDGITSVSGEHHRADVVIFATGFDVLRMVSTFSVHGRDGRSLREVWADDDARAYLGTAVPGFPNFFMLYGPNTQPGHGGSLMFVIEQQVNYLLDLLAQMAEAGVRSVDCREEVSAAYNARVDETNAGMVWTHDGVQTYYRNKAGRVTINLPYTNLDWWEMTRTAALDDYEVTS